MSTVETVQHSVMSSMLRGELEPGRRIRQDELAASLGVSKIPVREALHRMAATGLLRFESNRGVTVPTLTAADAEENFALRLAVEPLLLRRSLAALTIVDLAEAELALTEPEASTTVANWKFHRALYRPSGWAQGLAITETLHTAVAPYVALYTEDLGGGSHSDLEHRQLLERCRDGDVEEASEVLRRHLDTAADALVTFLAGR